MDFNSFSIFCFSHRHIVGKFPDYPTEKAGGSMAILSQKTPEQVLSTSLTKKVNGIGEGIATERVSLF